MYCRDSDHRSESHIGRVKVAVQNDIGLAMFWLERSESFRRDHTGDIKIKCANRQTTHRSIRHGSRVMDDLLQYIDADYYRSAQLLIARAEIVQLRRQSSALVRTEPSYKPSTGACPPADDLDQTAPAVAARTV